MVFEKKKPWVRFYVPPCRESISKFASRHLVEFLSQVFQSQPSSRAFVQVMPNGLQSSLNYGEVDALSDEFALYLREVLGLKSGDRVGVQLPNCLVYPVVVLGAWKAGAVVVNINPLSTGHEMANAFDAAPLKALVILDLFAGKLSIALRNGNVENVVVAGIATFFGAWSKRLVRLALKLKGLLPKWDDDWVAYESLSSLVRKVVGREKLLAGYLEGVGEKSLAVLQFTGGTTGVSKGVMLSHGNLMANVSQINQYAKANLREQDEVILTALPLYHIFAFTVNFLLFFYNGATNVLVPSPRPIGNLRKPMSKHNITWMTGVNTLFQALLESSWLSAKHVKRLRAAVAGGMALRSETAEGWRKTFGVEIVEGYGLSEASPVVAFNPIGGQVKVGTIGIPLPSTDVKCVDEEGKSVRRGEVGELIVKGPQVMDGYWRNEAETKAVLRRGWLFTGDMAQMDDEGYLRLVDRKKDVIIVSGFNVYPNEVEDCIMRLKEVAEVGVVGKQNKATGEVVKAVIVPRDGCTAALVQRHCKEFLSAYKVPKVVEFRDELPKTSIGKVSRKDLR